jgi:hypothetical protein
MTTTTTTTATHAAIYDCPEGRGWNVDLGTLDNEGIMSVTATVQLPRFMTSGEVANFLNLDDDVQIAVVAW